MIDAGSTVLIADDDKFIRDDIAETLSGAGCKLLFAATAAETWTRIASQRPNLVLLDIHFPDCRDLSLFKRIRAEAPDCVVIIVSSQTDNLAQVVEAIKLGAYDYVGKPFAHGELLNRVSNALSLQQLRRSNSHLLGEVQQRGGLQNLAGESAAMSQVRELITKLADAGSNVLVTGESGTGKELAARALHFSSRRKSNPFVAMNCASIPEALVESVLFGHKRGAFTGALESARGRFEAAEGGTLFLDEIGDMPLPQQASLLRVLEYRRFTPVGETSERECHARFVFGTNRDLQQCVRDGKFREDLFYRINVGRISMPPLRTRAEDIATIAAHFCQALAREMGRPQLSVAADALELFARYDWPGNVRELRNVLEAAVLLKDPASSVISIQDLPPEILALRSGPQSRHTAAERHEKEALIKTLAESGGNQTQAAKLLGCHRNTIRARIRYFGITDTMPG